MSRRNTGSWPADFDPGTHPILARHFFDVEPTRPVGSIAAEVVAGLRFWRQVIRLHRLGDRVLAEALAHLGAKHNIQFSIERAVDHFAELDPKTLQAAGLNFYETQPNTEPPGRPATARTRATQPHD